MENKIRIYKAMKHLHTFENFLNEDTLKENKDYSYIGTCVNSFDEYGECVHNAFSDEEDFFNSWNTAKKISKDEFWLHIDPSSENYELVKKAERDPKYTPEYRYSKESDVYFAFIDDDTHYFFVK
jgi:hypothetical protein